MKKKNPAANHRRIVELDQVVGVKVPLLSQVPARLGEDRVRWAVLEHVFKRSDT